MSIKILVIGKKHEDWVREGIERYEKRLKKPFTIDWVLLPHSAREGDSARQEESERILGRLQPDAICVLLDERGTAFDSPALSRALLTPLEQSRSVVLVIGGAYGVTPALRDRASIIWSLSPLVFPHQLVRLIVTEQLYRAQEIARGGSYHHQ